MYGDSQIGGPCSSCFMRCIAAAPFEVFRKVLFLCLKKEEKDPKESSELTLKDSAATAFFARAHLRSSARARRRNTERAQNSKTCTTMWLVRLRI